MGDGEKVGFDVLDHILCLDLHYFQPIVNYKYDAIPSAGTGFLQGFYQKCRAFRGALKNEKNKFPTFRGLIGHWITNVWCIMIRNITT